MAVIQKKFNEEIIKETLSDNHTKLYHNHGGGCLDLYLVIDSNKIAKAKKVRNNYMGQILVIFIQIISLVLMEHQKNK